MSDFDLRLDEVIHATAPADVIRRMQILQCVIEHGDAPAEQRAELVAVVKSGYQLIRRMDACATVAELDAVVPDLIVLASREGTGEAESSRWAVNKAVATYGACRMVLIMDAQDDEPQA